VDHAAHGSARVSAGAQAALGAVPGQGRPTGGILTRDAALGPCRRRAGRPSRGCRIRPWSHRKTVLERARGRRTARRSAGRPPEARGGELSPPRNAVPGTRCCPALEKEGRATILSSSLTAPVGASTRSSSRHCRADPMATRTKLSPRAAKQSGQAQARAGNWAARPNGPCTTGRLFTLCARWSAPREPFITKATGSIQFAIVDGHTIACL